mgnify:CR=1 FL=1
MPEYQKINDWCILEGEEDEAMLAHTRESIQDCIWHNKFVETHLIPHFLKSNRRTVIDVGASYGWMTVTFAKYFEQVKCFEIRKDIRYALEKNTSTFSNVEIFDCGLSDNEKFVKVKYSKGTGLSSIAPEHFDGPAIETDSNGNLVRSLDSYNFENVDCIKIDVENHEIYVLQGALDTIKKWKPVVIVEILFARKRHKKFFEPRQRIFKLFNSIDYEIADVRGSDFIFTHKSLNHYNDLNL